MPSLPKFSYKGPNTDNPILLVAGGFIAMILFIVFILVWAICAIASFIVPIALIALAGDLLGLWDIVPWL